MGRTEAILQDADFSGKTDILKSGAELQDTLSPTPFEIYNSGERLTRAETLKLSSVVTDYALVDEGHARELGDSMSQDRGQISPIVVRPRMNDSQELEYDVIDGFHRTEGQRQRGADNINAIVVYGCSDEEMYDLRILAASSVKSVQFPRIAEWITRSYEQTAWKQKGISVLQAFSIANTDRETSYRIRNQEELTELKSWIRDKCKSWQKSMAYVLNVLKIVDVADPALVKQVRVSGGGRDREAKVTPQRIQKIALSFPKNYPVQNEVMAASITNRMSAEETALLVEIAQPKILEIRDRRQLRGIIEECVIEVNRKSIERRRQEKAIHDEFLLIDEDSEAIDEFSDRLEEPKSAADETMLIENTVLPSRKSHTELDQLADEIAREALRKEALGLEDDDDEDYIDTRPTEYIRGGGYSVFDTADRGRSGVGYETEHQQTLQQLMEERNMLLEQLKNKDGLTKGWWLTADYLPPLEKRLLIDLFTEGKPISRVCREKSLGQAQVEALVRSALLRHQNKVTRGEKI